ncbi:MAG: hypothetical protein R2788_10155 [Saprospiraceae bacterium]
MMYTNKGTEASIGSTVEVTLDDFFTNIGSSIPWTSVNGKYLWLTSATYLSGIAIIL